jgi:hypothetical protein
MIVTKMLAGFDQICDAFVGLLDLKPDRFESLFALKPCHLLSVPLDVW